jgi:hypothetical protein
MERVVALFIIIKIIQWVFRLTRKRPNAEDAESTNAPLPESPDEGEREVSEEERRFKKWLDDVFGPKDRTDGYEDRRGEDGYRRGDDESAEEYDEAGEDDEPCAEGDGEDYDAERVAYVPPTPESIAAPPARVSPAFIAVAPASVGFGRRPPTAKNMAQGLIMAEIFAKPKALRPRRTGCSCRDIL